MESGHDFIGPAYEGDRIALKERKDYVWHGQFRTSR